jgi:hypothetical protein
MAPTAERKVPSSADFAPPTVDNPKTFTMILHANTVIVLTRALTDFALEEKAEQKFDPSESEAKYGQAVPSTVASVAMLIDADKITQSLHQHTRETSNHRPPSLFGDGTTVLKKEPAQPEVADPSAELQIEDQRARKAERAKDLTCNPVTPLHKRSDDLSTIPKGIAYYHVDSGALKEFSPVFCKMLTGEIWSEGIRQDDGKLYITIKDADPHDLEILLTIIHSPHHRYPLEGVCSLERIARIAVLVDYYQCREVTQHMVSKWIRAIANMTPVPKFICLKLMLWICTSFVFHIYALFKASTTVAIYNSRVASPKASSTLA